MTEVMKTDLLVGGGSLAGMSAAITAKEQYPGLDVTVVEKYTAGYAGKANRGAGILDVLGGSRPEDFVKYHATYIGDGLNNQQALYNFAADMNAGLEDLDRWSGGKVDKKEDGSFRTLKWLAQITGEDERGKRTFDEPDHFPWTLACVELDYMKNVRRTAQKAGVRFVDRVGVVDLLKSGGRVAGAVGLQPGRRRTAGLSGQGGHSGHRQPKLPRHAYVVSRAGRGAGRRMAGGSPDDQL